MNKKDFSKEEAILLMKWLKQLEKKGGKYEK